MKRLTAVLMVLILMVTLLAGCGSKDRELYASIDLADYVEIKDYIGIKVDTTSETFTNYCDALLADDIYNYELYTKIEEGTVADGDVVNLDYEGKLDGVAFSGGTAQGYDLEIGSGTFIDDFEEELIGVAVGETKDVTATFPTPYQNNPDLAGKEAIFTCKINYIQRPMTIEEAYSAMNFSSAEAYENDIKKRAVMESIFNTIQSKTKIKDYPEEDRELLGNAIYEFYVEDYKKYNLDFEQVLSYEGLTVEDFKSEMALEVMDTNMVMYYILDQEGLELLESTINSQDIDQSVIAESYAVQDTVMEYLYDNAVIK